MKRFLPVLLAFLACVVLAGCPGGDDPPADGAAASDSTATDGTPATGGGTPVGQFKEGIDSGRAEDGSDEEK